MIRRGTACVSSMAAVLVTAAAWGAPAVRYVPLTPQQLDTLTAPVALYPDPLVAQILPAATVPLEVVAASRWVQLNPMPQETLIARQRWQPSVKALVRYPVVLDRLASDVATTRRLGNAYLHQAADVMASIQRLRTRALAAGNLGKDPRQVVVVRGGIVYILPATDDTLHIPTYNPRTVYTEPAPVELISQPYPTGVWLDNQTDWVGQCITGGHHWDHERSRRFHPDNDVAPADSPQNGDTPDAAELSPITAGRSWSADAAAPIGAVRGPVRSPRPGLNPQNTFYDPAPPTHQPAAPSRAPRDDAGGFSAGVGPPANPGSPAPAPAALVPDQPAPAQPVPAEQPAPRGDPATESSDGSARENPARTVGKQQFGK